MKYELEFIGINKETTDADAICFRYSNNGLEKYHVAVYDGGTNDYGEALKEHIDKYYKPSEIDFVICSHSDQDHSSGLTIILENYKVKKLYMNRPWLYIDELYEKAKAYDARITKESLEKRLREDYSYIDDLEKLAVEKGVEVLEAFEGAKISDYLTILSPSKQFYLDMIVESPKTPLASSKTTNLYSAIRAALKKIIETWTKDSLREDVSTSPENETSIILYGAMEVDSFLLTGDAGIKALNNAINYAELNGIDLKTVELYQMPHHGSRHNVSPSVLDKLLGKIVAEGTVTNRSAFVSVAKGSDHPREMVTNAFIRRGVKVYEARESTIRHNKNMPTRSGWTAITPLKFTEQADDWED